ncbi:MULTISPECIES: ROK family transcriptional regulator [Leifsonia]|jgi:predicted NBD/HSP70 family sugar kinase|uniref:Putative NBD/HSP70 family sugar kinase n=1 Tax=Leifsonia naganoensis TaxID=150025 RepID=A0A853DSK8_9MICO|nr:ROK family transcriptional regulator [Leifsonia naganoensis]NYK10439.1 putative NBD/HSP70 family sugar kinase [Leifsonia naganoensis]
MAREAVVQSVEGSVGSRSLLRRMNSWGILRAVMERPQTMRDLAAESGLSRTAVDAIVTDLVDLGWLVPWDGSPAGRLGRPAASYRLAPGLGTFLSLDIGANHIYAVVTDLTGQVRGHLTVPTEEEVPAEERVVAALAVADDLLGSLGLDRSAAWAVAIGSPGAISTAGEVLHFGGTGMPGWIGLDLRERFRREFEAAVLVEGDVALGAHAELAIGAARDRSDVVYILCGARTSGASIVGGKVHRGVHGAAGIVGEMRELRWQELNEQYGSSVLATPRPSRQEIFEAARTGDPAAVAAVDEFADDLATGAAALTLAIDPELLVIGGGSSPSADVFLPRFEETLRGIVPLPPAVIASTLGSEAVAMGGISLAGNHLHSVLEGAVVARDAFPSPAESVELLRAAG